MYSTSDFFITEQNFTCGLDDWGSRVRFPAGAGNFPLHHLVQNGPGPQSKDDANTYLRNKHYLRLSHRIRSQFNEKNDCKVFETATLAVQN
jgi:hypothetical protein